MKPYIFVDLDETLIHTFEDWEDRTPDAVEIDVSGEKVWTSLRPGALDLLAQFRAIGDVYMLTIARLDYAIKMNQHFGLGFVEEEICDRERIQEKIHFLSPNETIIIFDNLPRRENRVKIEFLRQLTKKRYVIYLQCAEYRGHPDFGFTKESIEFFLGQIYSQVVLPPPAP